MTFDHIALIVSIMAIAILYGALYLVKFMKAVFINKKKRTASEKINRFGSDLDKYKFGPTLLVISGSSFMVWIITRVVLSYN